MATRDPLRVMTCRKCRLAGEAEPFRGTFAELGRHHQVAHPKESGAEPPAADVSRETSAAAPADPLPGDTLGAPAPGDYTHPREQAPGGVTVEEPGAEGSPKPRRNWREKLWGGGDAGAGDEGGAPMSRSERRPVKGRRSATDQLFAMAWRFAGTRLERSERDIVVGRCMVYQSPVAGDVLEKLTKGTIIDRVLQPFAARTAELETAGALFMLPMLVGMLERNPEMVGVLEPMIRDAIRVHLVAMVPIIKKQRAEAATLADAVKDLYPDAPEGTDPTELVLAEMFAGTAFDPDAQPAPETRENVA